MKEVVIKIIREVLSAAGREFMEGVSLWDLGMDSLASVELMTRLEETFGIEFPIEMISPETFDDVDTIVGALTTLSSASAKEADGGCGSDM